MFQTEVDENRSFLAFALQQILVCVGSVVWGLITMSLPFWLSRFGVIGRLLEGFSIVSLVAAPSFLAGRLIGSGIPRIGASGRWVWVLPSALIGIALLSSSFTSGIGRNISELFFPPPDGEAWWAVWFFTCPTIACVGYSFGIEYERRKSSQQVP
jgi:hypothetical protein